MNVSGSQPILPANAPVSNRSAPHPPSLYLPPPVSGAPGGPTIVAANAVALSEKKGMPSILEQLANNFVSTAKMTASALKTVGQEWASNIKEGETTVLFRFIVSTIGAVLYSGSLIAGAAIKATLWLPVIGLTAIASVATGLIAVIVSGDKKIAIQVKDFTEHLVGWSLTSVTAFISGITILARGPLWITGALGALCMMRWSPENQTQANEQRQKLGMGLYQTLQDALLLWTGGSQNIWNTTNDFFGDPVHQQENQRRLIELLRDMGANVYSVESRKYSLSKQSQDLLNEVFGPNVANQLQRKDNR